MLLQKNPSKRLGSPASGGTEAIMNHPFFEGLDWAKILARGYPTPIKPKVKNEGDTKHIAKMFLKQEIRNTPVDGELDLKLMQEMHFDNFTYKGSVPLEESGSHLRKGSPGVQGAEETREDDEDERYRVHYNKDSKNLVIEQ